MNMSTNFRVFVVLSIMAIAFSQCYSQLTFSRNWEAPGGKRSGHPLPLPEAYFKLSANSICQYLLSEIKQMYEQMAPCETRSEESSVFSTN